MEPQQRHEYQPAASFNGGDLDCGNGLLLLIRKHIDPLLPGQLLEVTSSEISVEEDLPAWCRLTKNDLVSWTKAGKIRSYLICKGPLSALKALSAPDAAADAPSAVTAPASSHPDTRAPIAVTVPASSHLDTRQLFAVPAPASSHLDTRAPLAVTAITSSKVEDVVTVPPIQACSVMGIGSWPRPKWLLRSLHEKLSGRMSGNEFEQTANDAVRLAVTAQMRAGAGVITDGEQRRDSYASFVGGILDNCQLVPLVDLLPLVEDPEKFAAHLKSLDIAADTIRHPAVFGRISRTRPLTLDEFHFARSLTDLPIKIALPGPYVLTRTMWLECISEKVYRTREELADDIVMVLRAEISELLNAGVSLVQIDEPVLSEAAFSATSKTRSFMCGALGERGESDSELRFAVGLINRVVESFDPSRIAMHMCRGNWSPDEGVALAGDYTRLLPFLSSIKVGTLFLEFCTPRAGELEVIKDLPQAIRLGIGVVNPKDPAVERAEVVAKRIEHAISLFGPDRLVFTPDCGFATFADNPVVSSADIAEGKLKSIRDGLKLLDL